MTEENMRNDQLDQLAQRLGFPINDKTLFDRALTHASLSGESEERLPDYESLEFLGDAVLGLAAAHHLFETRPDLTPGEYTRMRAALINRRCVARVGRKLEIASAIRLGKGEEQAGGRQRTALIADCMEALIGAVYLDSGWQEAHAFVVRSFQEEFENTRTSGHAWDFKSRLQHFCQANRLELPRFEVVRASGPDHCKHFEIEVFVDGNAAGRGEGSTKKEAEQQAARDALEKKGQHFG
jgi:ribonuclease-3